MTYLTCAYLLYLCITIILTVWVATTLQKNGKIFLIDSFNGNEALAESINHLLVVGFYLINIGYISVALKETVDINNFQQVIELLSSKVGWVSIILGVMHFFNIMIFSNMRKKAIRQNGQYNQQQAQPVGNSGKVNLNTVNWTNT